MPAILETRFARQITDRDSIQICRIPYMVAANTNNGDSSTLVLISPEGEHVKLTVPTNMPLAIANQKRKAP